MDLELPQPLTLSRAQSMAIVGARIDNKNALMLTRTYSVPDVNSYHRRHDPYKPQFSIYTYPMAKYRPYFPYRYTRDCERGAGANSFWYNRYYRFTPFFKRSVFRPYFFYRHDFDNPSYSRRAYDPFYTPYFDPYSYGNWARIRQHYV